MAGVEQTSDIYRNRPKKPAPVEDMYKVYNAAVKQQAGDYDDIMGRFKQIYGTGGGQDSLASGFTPYTAERAQYDRSPDTTSALANLRELTQSGGLSAGDVQNLRARGISPIRSLYSGAQRDLNRQRNLAGGYSPNYGAVTAKMTRDQSSLIADQMANVNAGIAEMVQRGKLATAPQYASAAQDESSLKNKFNLENAQMANDAKKFNLTSLMSLRQQDKANDPRLSATKGMADLYGTTPALANLYGTQAMNTAQFQNSVNQNKKRQAGGVLADLMRR